MQQLPGSGVRFDEDSTAEARAWLLKVQMETQRSSPAGLLCKVFKPDATAQVEALQAGALLQGSSALTHSSRAGDKPRKQVCQSGAGAHEQLRTARGLPQPRCLCCKRVLQVCHAAAAGPHCCED